MPLKAFLPDVNNWGYDSHWIYGLLTPFSFFYSLGVRARTLAYRAGVFKAKRLPCFTISVGNITLGGTGKTPLVIGICNYLTDLGLKVAVLSRGYRRKGKDPIVVSEGDGPVVNVEKAGDEPYLIALKTKAIVAVGKDRSRAFELIRHKEPDVVILDDGFQHLKLHRDLDLCLIDATREFGNGRLFPSGPLREPPGAISRADAIVITKGRKINFLFDTPCIFLKPVFFYNPQPKTDKLPKKAVLITGIANPSYLEKQLSKVAIAEKRIFPDHHRYRAKDFSGIDLPVITTLKDYVKFPEDIKRELNIFVIDQDTRLPEDLIKFIREKVCP